ncbi:MAG: DciA family protein [Gammaproteobacteria bacterium]|nr:DciA family protein [Gammaproteobacteria bacterium]
MEEIGLLLKRIMPEAPDDLMTAAALAPLWAAVATGALGHAHPLGYCRGRLFVAVPGSSFSARLRQEQPRLVQALRKAPGLRHLQEIVPRPWPGAAVPRTCAEPLRCPSAPDCVEALAAAVDDEALRASLARLAASMRGSGDSADPVV